MPADSLHNRAFSSFPLKEPVVTKEAICDQAATYSTLHCWQLFWIMAQRCLAHKWHIYLDMCCLCLDVWQFASGWPRPVILCLLSLLFCLTSEKPGYNFCWLYDHLYHSHDQSQPVPSILLPCSRKCFHCCQEKKKTIQRFRVFVGSVVRRGNRFQP